MSLLVPYKRRLQCAQQKETKSSPNQSTDVARLRPTIPMNRILIGGGGFTSSEVRGNSKEARGGENYEGRPWRRWCELRRPCWRQRQPRRLHQVNKNGAGKTICLPHFLNMVTYTKHKLVSIDGEKKNVGMTAYYRCCTRGCVGGIQAYGGYEKWPKYLKFHCLYCNAKK